MSWWTLRRPGVCLGYDKVSLGLALGLLSLELGLAYSSYIVLVKATIGQHKFVYPAKQTSFSIDNNLEKKTLKIIGSLLLSNRF
jgi:hypothetical protein